MEEVGTQVAPPVFIHQTLGGRFYETHPAAKKRGLAYQGPFQHQHQHQQQQQLQNLRDNWNPNSWDWDSLRFVAKPLESDVLRLGVSTSLQSEQLSRRDGENGRPGLPMMVEKKQQQQQQQQQQQNHVDNDDNDNESLQLQLGGSPSLISVEEPVSRPNKRVRSGSPGSTNYPMCQVDNCKEDLSNAKDYHRRHKVCELHSKSSKAIVGKQMQRFCQQCSRFHPLSEFDEGKRSCRRRLAGHNRRRRKSQPEDVTSRPLLPSNCDQSGSGNLDIVNLLAALARAQGNNDDKAANFSSLPNRDHLIQILSKINSLPLPAEVVAKLCMPGTLNRNNPEGATSDARSRLKGDASSPSTMDLLAVLQDTLTASASSALSILSETNTVNRDAEKTKLACLNQDMGLNPLKQQNMEFPSVGGESSTSYQSPVEDSDSQVQGTRAKPLHLFRSSGENASPPNLGSTRKYFSSDSSNRTEERSPSASPPVVQKLFPVQTSKGTGSSATMLFGRVCNVDTEGNKTRESITSLDLFRGAKGGAGTGFLQGFPHQAGYTSSSGSDYSPPSLNSDAQDRTGRILFKLFDKDPSHLPMTLRTQIYNWLSHSPSEMESYIRPGCIVLSVYISMSSSAWDQLEENLLQRVNSLVQESESDFWRNGRFLVHTGRIVVSHKEGKTRLCKSWRTWTSPELICVSPLAVVGGEETTFLLKGRNLSSLGAKIHCMHIGGCISKDAPASVCQGTIYDEISWDLIKIQGAAANKLGRCFIEVENGFKGTSFPIIVADAPICKELRLLETEFDEIAKEHDTISRDTVQDFVQPRSREVVVHFLNELGWLFQRKMISSALEGPDFKMSRFKFLFIFSVERNYCALVKTLLDILVERSLGRDGLSSESMGMLSEVHLLNRAVKRRCRDMVDLLLHYSVRVNDTSKMYIFPPNLCGPDGVTPLHLAASTSNSDDIIDALTSDPLETGLRSWSSLLDANGMSPYAYASMRNSHSYNKLVAGKLASKISEVSVLIGNEIEQQHSAVDKDDGSRSQLKRRQKSCSKCAVVAARYNNRRFPGSQGLLHRPYIHSMLAIAAVCVCVCLFLRGAPDIGLVAPFKWENLEFGPI